MKKNRRDKKLIKSFVITGVVFALVVSVAAFFILADGANRIKNFILLSGASHPNAYYYQNAEDGDFGLISDGFVVLTKSGFRVFDKKGEDTLHVMKSFNDPAITTGGKYAAAWDMGGYSIVYFSAEGKVLDLELEDRIISASVNSRGWLCVCTEQTGYGGVVTVYNTSGDPVYRFKAGTAYILGAKLRDNKELMVITVGEEGSELTLMPITSEKATAKYAYDGIIVDAEFMAEGVAAVTERELLLLDKSLNNVSTFDYSEKHLAAYNLNGDTALIVTGEYVVGGTREASLISSGGQVLGAFSIGSELTAVDAVDGRAAFLSGGKITVCGENLRVLGEHDAPGAGSVLIANNMSVIAAGDFAADVFPGLEEPKE